jgi:hypothetical protein
VQQDADVLVKYTYNGDVNGDGRINSDDYFRIDSGFLAQPAAPTYHQGDFNFDETINSDDYFLIDSAFLGQGAPLAAASASASAPAASSAVVRTRTGVSSEPAARKPLKKHRPVKDPVFSLNKIRRRAPLRGSR